MPAEERFGSDKWLATLDFVSLAAERDEQHRQATARLLHGLLDIVDSLSTLEGSCQELAERGVEHSPVGPVRLIIRQALRLLAEAGVEPVPAAGAPLDLARHEVVGVRPDSEAAEGTVVAEAARGYCWNGTLLRRAQVVVARPLSANEDRPDARDRH